MASPPTNLKETILAKSRELFEEQGFAGTSIKQIAKASGCTNAALYYYFEGGKAHIRREVIYTIKFEVIEVLNDDDVQYDNLAEFLHDFNKIPYQNMPKAPGQMDWIISEFDILPEAEQEFLRNLITELQIGIQRRVMDFMPEDQARMLSWIIVCSYAGYGQTFLRMGVETKPPFSLEDLATALAKFYCQE